MGYFKRREYPSTTHLQKIQITESADFMTEGARPLHPHSSTPDSQYTKRPNHPHPGFQ
jgi:hypothetical protein